MKTITAILISIMMYSFEVTAQETVQFDLLKSSSITIYGNSNITPFNIYLKGDNFPEKRFSVKATEKDNKIFISGSVFSVDVNRFTSGNKMALRDFKKLIKSDVYPEISVEVTSLDIKKSACGKKENIDATGTLTITGVRKSYAVSLNYNESTDVYSATGSIKVNIRDFGLKPPVEMLGLIKVSEWIDINFKLNFNLAKARDSKIAENIGGEDNFR